MHHRNGRRGEREKEGRRERGEEETIENVDATVDEYEMKEGDGFWCRASQEILTLNST